MKKVSAFRYLRQLSTDEQIKIFQTNTDSNTSNNDSNKNIVNNNEIRM